MGELKIVENADWNIEIGALSVLSSKHIENTPALLFDRIKDYPAGYRILVGFFESLRHSALTTTCPSTLLVKVSSRLAAGGWPRISPFRPSPFHAGRFSKTSIRATISISSSFRFPFGTNGTVVDISAPAT